MTIYIITRTVKGTTKSLGNLKGYYTSLPSVMEEIKILNKNNPSIVYYYEEHNQV